MTEKLLSKNDICKKLGISRSTFWRKQYILKAKGLQVVRIGKQEKYRAASFDKLIVEAAETETPVY
ncbi:MAG: hypothetical protein A2Y10_19655 [Planctomycetes bacterium GWF2_41_51]|nr:MAG: hypothetical protein A2Y10_19655 [Planctomycetes bacterium GWF2_41_51]HBG28196.1 DNA-binding protein [Phycisphaerales bacterium]